MDWWEFIYDVILACSLVIVAIFSIENYFLLKKLDRDFKYAAKTNNNGICYIVEMLEDEKKGKRN